MEYVLLGAGILVVGAVVWWLYRRRTPSKTEAEIGEELGGYGAERWQREIAVWQGTLRRLERQADRYDEVPPHLRQQIERAKQRIARARRALDEHTIEERDDTS